jgi:hypothetical protein
MCYNRRGMVRRGVIGMLLIVVVGQIAGGMLFASVCNQPCPDDNGRDTCPPICSFCTTCAHAQQAVVQVRAAGAITPLPVLTNVFTAHPLAATQQRADDIFHVPLLG